MRRQLRKLKINKCILRSFHLPLKDLHVRVERGGPTGRSLWVRTCTLASANQVFKSFFATLNRSFCCLSLPFALPFCCSCYLCSSCFRHSTACSKNGSMPTQCRPETLTRFYFWTQTQRVGLISFTIEGKARLYHIRISDLLWVDKLMVGGTEKRGAPVAVAKARSQTAHQQPTLHS